MINLFRTFRTNLAPTLLRLFTALLLLGVVMTQMPVSTVRAAGTDLTLTKTIEGGATHYELGDVIRYRIHFACSNLTTPCGPMEIKDVLQAGLIYQPPPASSVPAGFTITEAPVGTLTITKDDANLLDGSQYDAVIAVKVDYNLRTLPALIDNQVTGRIAPTGPGNWENATPANAPQITIDTANPHWAITKTLSSPSINPTVNTDVTYQIQLCPTAPPPGEGNVGLNNIKLTDVIPAGATFVTASNGGTFAAGTVTWPTVAGPLFPPNCLTRFVTIRYNTPTFTVGGPPVTNSAHVNADYTPSTGTCTTPCIGINGGITHPIDPIAETPSYNKDDTGDPVGFTGTGRFTLDLNTNLTNFPSNNLILIDNMPPQFRITSVTSGQWSSAFDYVHAFVEYSTNNGSTYTSFPGSPANFNTNATYAAPVTNITNVRWRFEYDPDKTAPFAYTQAGLPYTWSFTSTPEIRVTPRSAPVNTDPPAVVTLPAAVAGTTYTNCLQVSRTNSLGNPVLDACNNESMTVQGSFVSLRTSKNETPGTAWDDLSDPTITTFTPDGSILPGDTLRYTVTIELTERSSTPLVNPTIQDTLPPATDFVFVRNGTATLDGTPLGAAQQPTFSQAGQVLTWAWNNPSPALTINPLALGSHFLTVEFYAYVPRGQAPGTYTNNLYAVTDSAGVVCEIGTAPADTTDIDGDTNTTELGCKNPDTYIVERSAALRGEKWIRSTDASNGVVVDATTFAPPVLPSPACPNGGIVGLPGGGSNTFTRYPCISQAFPEGALNPGQLVPPPPAVNPALDDFEYNLRIFNDGNVPMLSYVLYDILPYVGDTGSGGTLANSSRLSEFRPLLRGPVQFISGPPGLTSANFTIEYNATTNPCRPEVFDQPTGGLVPGGCDNTWVPGWSTAARSYRIRLNSGTITPASTSSEVRFGVPMNIPADAPPAGFDLNDALSHEIAWNSFAHVGAYDKNPSSPPVNVQDLLASEPRKVGITVPERMSVGNRIWRDADNNGTINSPDDTSPGIAGVTVNLYRDVNGDGIADGAAIATTTTDTEGYYLFSNIPFDSTVNNNPGPNNNRYIIGIPATNFAVGQPLFSLRSSTGAGNFPTPNDYTNPPENGPNSTDHGIDPVLPPPPAPSTEVFGAKFILNPGTEVSGENDLSNNNRDGLPGQRRGVNGERDANSDLTKDFGFFGGDDVPFSIGNHVWKDNGQGAGGIINDGIRQSGEPPVVGALVRLYRDGDLNGIPTPAELIRTDTTDAGGFYLFDDLDPGHYFVEIAPINFTAGQPLAGWYSSQPTGTETLGVDGGITTADIDNDDNGINAAFPEINGVFSGVIDLATVASEPTGETFLSSDTGSAPGFDPTTDDGPNSRGRFGEADNTSNLTIDFGFIPPMSIGNRVWIDEGSGTASFRTDFNNGIQDTGELGVSGVRVELWRDTNATAGLQVTGATPDTFMYFTTTDATGYYLFERLQPGTNYFLYIPTSNFTGAGPLVNFLSSTDIAPPADNFVDKNDNGVDNPTPAANGIASSQISMQYGAEPITPTNETDINISGTYGPQNVGTLGQADRDSNLTQDFGFVRPPRSIGNRLWIDTNNNGVLDVGEPSVPTGVRVSLYLDANNDGQPDDLGTLGDRTDDWIAFDLTDAGGFYLFDDLPRNRYIVGVDRLNFVAGGLLDGYNSSTGNVDNSTNNTNELDNGVDRLLRADPVASPHGILSTQINLRGTPVGAPTTDHAAGTISTDTGTGAGFNPTFDDGPTASGRFGEADNNSDLTIDFGFFIPMSLGNRVFLDDGTGGGTYNNGIMDGGETPVANVRVELYHDNNNDGIPDVGGLIGFDVTDAGGYYLFDDIAEGKYVVLIPGGNFTASFDPDGAGPLPTAAGALLGRDTSTPTGTETVGVVGDPYTPNTDRDDNGLNVGSAPTTGGVRSGTITLAHNTEPTGEAELSGQADPGSPANLAFSPTGWDGPTPGSRGRWDEIDSNSNLTIDFGFIPVFSLGNRVFFDTNNDSARNVGEVGVDGVKVQLFDSTGTTEILVGPDGILNTADDAAGGMTTAGGGYYRFNDLPAGNYMVVIPASNFGVGQPLQSYWSSATTMDGVGTISETTAFAANSDVDSDDNGTLSSGRVVSSVVTLGPTITSEPLAESDLSGGQGQPDGQANMTVDFGFYRVELGNLVYLDNNANGTNDAGDTPISGKTVQLYAANGTTEINVGLDGILGTTDDLPGGMVTNGTGNYLFSGLPQGQYIVKTSSTATTFSTIDSFNATDNATPDTNADNNDNGIGTAGGTVSSGTVTLTPGSPGALSNNTITNASGTTSNPTLDFGFVGMVALGNRVWLDDGAGGGISNNGKLDGTEIGVDGVRVELYTSAGTFVTFTTTSTVTGNKGYYQFDLLYPGTYYTFIPPTEFQSGKPLETYYSSAGNGANETSDETTDENGIDNANPATNGIRSTNFTLLGGTEITGEGQANYTGTLTDNSVNFTDDFAFTQKYSIGNRIWFDTNNGSTINGSEVGVDGVTVNLYAASNLAVILATDTTANGGYYLFDDLYPGDYVVSVAASNFSGAGALVGYWSSGTSRDGLGAITETAAALANSDTDSDDNGMLQTAGPLNGAVISSTVTLGPSGNTEPTLEGDLEPVVGQGNQADGRANMTADFGFYKTVIGNLVFSDADKSGDFNAGDTLLSGVTVQLYAANGTTLLASTSTAAGIYGFDGQPEGDYIVKAVTPIGMTSTIDTFDSADNANPDVNTDNNDNGIGQGSGTVAAGTLTMIAAEGAANITVTNATGSTTDLTVDFGFVPLYSLGNRIWLDLNNNSLMDGGELGKDGVVVDLYIADGAGNPTGVVLATDTTTGGGFYLFDDLFPNDYVVVVRKSNFASGGPLAGYWSSATSISAGGVISETAAPDADTVATDADDNGTLDTSGGTFDGAVLSKAVTLGPSGGTEPTGEVATQLESGVLGNQGNQPDDRANMTVDFGFYSVEVGNLVYLDNNGNGNYDGAGDTVLPGITVKLFASNGTTEIPVGPDGILGTVDDAPGGRLTNPGGLYIFASLPEGQYIIKVTPPAGTSSTIDSFNAADNSNPNTNADDNDNGIGTGNGQVASGIVTLTPGSTGALGNNSLNSPLPGITRNPTIDFGFVNQVAIGNRVWFDTGVGGGISNNGKMDGTESGVNGVVVQLYTSAGVEVPVGPDGILGTGDDGLGGTVTSGGGFYSFDQLYPGDYYVFIPPTEFQSGKPLETYFSSLGNGANETSDETGAAADENGIDDAAPATNGIRSTTYTLTAGGEITGEGQANYTGVLPDNSVNFTADFGFTQKYSIGNRVWFDTDNSGTINGTEVGINGVTVNLYAASDLTTILATDTTATGGYYLFDDLYPGDYVVSVDASNLTGAGVLTGYWSSATSRAASGVVSETTAALANSDTDSDDNGTLQTAGALNGSVISSTVTVGPSGNTEPTLEGDLEPVVGQGNQADGRANMTVDFGFYTLSLGNLVWSDTDKNGAFNGSEVGIDGVPVELWSSDGSTQLGTTTTAGGGFYNFPGLPTGDYTVHVVAPVGTTSSVDTFAPLDTTTPTTNTDNNDNGVGTGGGTIVSNPVTLTPGAAQSSNTVNNAAGSTANPSMDFGFTPVFSLGNRVWFDTDNSGTINGTEVGIKGVTVNLYAASDLTTVLATQVTVTGGYYLFNGLQAGDYVVSVAASNLTGAGVLTGYWSSATSRAANGVVSETTAPLANSDTDSDDNGTLQTSGALNGAVTSSVITLGPAINAEPAGETDLDATLPGNQQGQPDTQANMTVDFGFYTITLGDLVWNDLDNSGLLDGAETGIDGVTVELWSNDVSALLGTTTTAGGGIYTFSGLPASGLPGGDYIVRLPAANFNPGGVLRDYRSSTGPLPALAYEPAPDADTDTTNSDDNGSETNGLLGLGGYIQSLPVTLTPAAEESSSDVTGTTLESRVDFGVNNSPQIDLKVTKTDNQTFYGVSQTLNYDIVVTNNGPADAIGMSVTDVRPAQITSWTWTCDIATPLGYNCTNDATNPATFTDSLDLPQLASVTYHVSAVVSATATGDLINAVVVTPPQGMTDMTPPDNTATDIDKPASLTVTKDDGVQIAAPGAVLTYLITVTNNGNSDLSGILLTDTIPTGTTFTSATGGGTFATGVVTWPLFNLAVGASTTRTVIVQVADEATLSAGSITSLTNTVDVHDDGSHTGGTPLTGQHKDIDQVLISDVKALTGTDQAGSTDPHVLIGEILTYSIKIDVPVGTIINLTALDLLDHGLAFVGCDTTTPIISTGLTLQYNPCTDASHLKVQAEPVTDTNPKSDDAGRRVTFEFGQVQNTSGSTQSLIVNYRVIVLDIKDNVNGLKNLNNKVVWNWEGGTLSGSATDVDIVEPDLSIEKTVNNEVAAIGSVVTYTIAVEQTKKSHAPAYDVQVTDNLAAPLLLDKTSIKVKGSSGLPTPTITTTNNSFTIYWPSFPIGEKAEITFKAQFIGPSPAVNKANVVWKSIPVLPGPIFQPKSPYNQHSTERGYDPKDLVPNDYGTESSVVIRTPGKLPNTGFAPGVRTVLPAQPLGQAYSAMDGLWLEIPALNLKMPIVGIPYGSNGWDLTWLSNQAGYLEGTTYPAQVGTTAMTGHVYLADGTPGPFLHLANLAYGDQVILHIDGKRYVYEVRTNKVVLPGDLSVFKNDGYTWMTLLTCKDYLPSLKTYDYRQAVRAVLVKVENEP